MIQRLILPCFWYVKSINLSVFDRETKIVLFYFLLQKTGTVEHTCLIFIVLTVLKMLLLFGRNYNNEFKKSMTEYNWMNLCFIFTPVN